VNALHHEAGGTPAVRQNYSNTIRGKWNDTTQFGTSTVELMRRSAQTLHSMEASTDA